MTINDFEMLEPMKYYDNPEPKTDSLRQKRQDIIDNKNNLYIATEKHDGDWGMFIHYCRGRNLIRSRSISKVTGKYGDYTAKLPHLCGEMDKWPDNTVVLAEICWDEYNTNANTVGTILRCLPDKAVERQKDKKLSGLIFDVLMIGGEDLTATPYIDRLSRASDCGDGLYFKPTQIFRDNFAVEADRIISNGGEGLVIQRKINHYLSGTRTAWASLKMKQALPHLDLKVVDTIEPQKEYAGDFSDNWQYKLEDGTLVTKPYFMGWKNGVVVQLDSGITTAITSGLTDDDRAYLSTPEAQTKIKNGELWAEVKAMSVNDLGKLRHGSLVRLRTDLNSQGE